MAPEAIKTCIAALDALGVALTDHEHVWTDEERRLYQRAVSLITIGGNSGGEPIPATAGAEMRATMSMFNEDEFAAIIGVTTQTLAKWRSGTTGVHGPDYVKLGKTVFYRKADIEKWMQGNVCGPDGVIYRGKTYP